MKVGNAELPCYVLEDGKRVLSQRGLIASLGLARGADRLAVLLEGKSIFPHVSAELIAAIRTPIKFLAGSAGDAFGYEATILADICDAVLAARKAGGLQPQQDHIADQAEILIRGFARVGIVALVDEATGYQEVRDRTALQAILDKWLDKEFAAWAKRFPDDFYKQIFRLRGWEWKGMKVNRPSCVASYTTNIVYDRLEVGLRSELEKRNPVQENGHRLAKHHQWLTTDVGHPKLSEHIHAVTAFMRIAPNWDSFIKMLDKGFPKKGATLLMDFVE